ncbi:GPIX protein, partial [Formicarius rufipectus]|nr:GPIX protein [Formicarius rufipectus]
SVLPIASVLLSAALVAACPARCRCPAGSGPGLRVDCSSLQLRAVPALPSGTRSLDLRNNSLRWVPAGALDGPHSLSSVEVAGNPWHCDCRILYLKLWLQDFSAPALSSARCASPERLRMRALAELTGNELGTCKRLLPVRCLEFFWRDLFLIAGAIVTLLLAAWALKFSKKLVCQLKLSRGGGGGWLLRRLTSKNH